MKVVKTCSFIALFWLGNLELLILISTRIGLRLGVLYESQLNNFVIIL